MACERGAATAPSAVDRQIGIHSVPQDVDESIACPFNLRRRD